MTAGRCLSDFLLPGVSYRPVFVWLTTADEVLEKRPQGGLEDGEAEDPQSSRQALS